MFSNQFQRMRHPFIFSLILIVHFLLWLLLINHSTGVVMTFSDQGIELPENYIVKGLVYSMLFNALLFYSHYSYLIKKYLPDNLKKYFLYGSCLLLLITGGETWADLVQLNQTTMNYPAHLAQTLFYFNIKINIAYWFLAVIFKIIIDWLNQVKTQKEIKAKQTETELALLKSQVHPHFLFNTLNTLYSSAYESGDDITADGIGRLSHLLRYMLYETQTQKVPLDNEIDYLKDYISLQEMRFAQDTNVDFHITGDTGNYMVAPMLLITLVENAFKHGISPALKTSITINLIYQEEKLVFIVENDLLKTRSKSTLEGSAGGLGLINLKKRLTMIYPQQHSFESYNANNKFIAQLELTT